MVELNELIKPVSQEPDKHCRVVKIKKRSGGVRKLCVPSDEVREIENRAKLTLTRIYSKLTQQYITGWKCKPHAFINGKSVKTAVLDALKITDRRKIIIRVDIKKFFPSIKRCELIKSIEPALEHVGNVPFDVVGYIRACTPFGGLAQGYPNAPLLSNIYMVRFDNTIVATLADKYKNISQTNMHMIRYCDDIYVVMEKNIVDPHKVVDEVDAKLSEYGLHLNRCKTKITDAHNRQKILGVVVNSNMPRLPKETRRKIRNWIVNSDKQIFNVSGTRFLSRKLAGKVEYALMVSDHGDRWLISAVLSRLRSDKEKANVDTPIGKRFQALYKEATMKLEAPYKVTSGYPDIDVGGMF